MGKNTWENKYDIPLPKDLNIDNNKDSTLTTNTCNTTTKSNRITNYIIEERFNEGKTTYIH